MVPIPLIYNHFHPLTQAGHSSRIHGCNGVFFGAVALAL
jgi:hypothetical protein